MQSLRYSALIYGLGTCFGARWTLTYRILNDIALDCGHERNCKHWCVDLEMRSHLQFMWHLGHRHTFLAVASVLRELVVMNGKLLHNVAYRTCSKYKFSKEKKIIFAYLKYIVNGAMNTVSQYAYSGLNIISSYKFIHFTWHGRNSARF